MKPDFDLIIYGATGYTGRLIAEYLATSYRGDDAPSWKTRPHIEGTEKQAQIGFAARSLLPPLATT